MQMDPFFDMPDNQIEQVGQRIARELFKEPRGAAQQQFPLAQDVDLAPSIRHAATLVLIVAQAELQ
jgi:hypothetical protein